jgi:hypothetical protein
MAATRLVGVRWPLGESDRPTMILLECAVIYAVARSDGVETTDMAIVE